MHSLASDSVRRAGSWVLAGMLAGLAAVSGEAQPETGETMYLSDVADLAVVACKQGWGLDSVGIMTLTLPAGTVEVGKSVQIGVKGSASRSKRFFMFYKTP